MADSLSVPPSVEYPSSDGKPIAEGDTQRKSLTYAVERLDIYFRNDPDVYVSGNLLLYYEEGDPRARVAPDVFVVFGARKALRDTYLLWEEPKAPDFVLEITSLATKREDQEDKHELYRRLGVREYWLYDPARDYLEPPLRGLKLVGGEYRRLPERDVADGTLALRSEVLGLELRLQMAKRMRFHDPQTGEDLLDLRETDDRRRDAARRAAELRG